MVGSSTSDNKKKKKKQEKKSHGFCAPAIDNIGSQNTTTVSADGWLTKMGKNTENGKNLPVLRINDGIDTRNVHKRSAGNAICPLFSQNAYIFRRYENKQGFNRSISSLFLFFFWFQHHCIIKIFYHRIESNNSYLQYGETNKSWLNAWSYRSARSELCGVTFRSFRSISIYLYLFFVFLSLSLSRYILRKNHIRVNGLNVDAKPTV